MWDNDMPSTAGDTGDSSSGTKKGGLSKDTKDKLSAAGKSLRESSGSYTETADRLTAEDRGVPSYRKGGRVRKTGLIHAHRGEEVVRPEEANKVRKFLKKHKNEGREDDPKETMRKGDPKKTARKGSPARMEAKEDVRKTARKGSPERINDTKHKHKRGMGRKSGRGM